MAAVASCCARLHATDLRYLVEVFVHADKLPQAIPEHCRRVDGVAYRKPRVSADEVTRPKGVSARHREEIGEQRRHVTSKRHRILTPAPAGRSSTAHTAFFGAPRTPEGRIFIPALSESAATGRPVKLGGFEKGKTPADLPADPSSGRRGARAGRRGYAFRRVAGILEQRPARWPQEK